MTLKNKDLDIYFHMRNHYKKIQNPKSTFNFSFPKAVAKRTFCSSPHCNTTRRTMKFEDKHFSNFVHIPYYDVPKHHVCAYSEDRTSDTALLPRPRTRRNPNDWSPDEMLDRKYRSQSVGGIPIKSKNSKKNSCYSARQLQKGNYALQEPCNYEYRNQNSYRTKKKISRNKNASTVSCSTYTGNEEEESEIVTGRSIENKRGIGDAKSVGSIEEHEYLQFLLRITEDIIINNYILNEDIERVFNQHMEMNKHVLDEKKMEQHIANLALELNISEEKIDFEKDSSLQIPPSYINLLCLNTACECESPKSQFGGFLTTVADVEASHKDNFDDRVYYRHSLGRVTECTEPSNSSSTVVARISNPNFIDLSSTEYLMITTKSDMIVASKEDVGKDLHIRQTLSEILITDKTSPEDSLKDIPKETAKAYDNKLEETGKTYIIEPKETLKLSEINVEENCVSKIEIPLKIDCGTDTAFAEEQTLKTADAKIQTSPLHQIVYEQSIQTSPRLLLKKPSTFDRSTQSTSIVSNKKCDTEDLTEYILIKNKDLTPEVILEDEIPLTNRTELEGGLNTFLELKLLGDDYDLTPERDTSEKYHFLMTDAATMCHSTIPLTGIEEESLLLGDMYELDDESALKRMLNNRDTYVYRKAFAGDDEGSSSSDHVDFFSEYTGWFSDKTGLCYSNNEKFGTFESILKINSCTSTSSISVKT